MSDSPQSIDDVVRHAAEINHRTDRAPLAVGAQSPITEIIAEHLAATMPEPIRSRIRSEPRVEAVLDWITVGALYRCAAAHGDIRESAAFNTLPTDPKRAVEVAAQALAAQLGLPARPAPGWYSRLFRKKQP